MDRVWRGFVNYSIVLIGGMLSHQLWAIDIPATTEWYRPIEMTSIRSGIVEKVPVDVGDQLKSGSLLLQLEHKLESAQLLFTREKLHQAELLYKEAQREYERIEDLYERTLISDHDRALGEAEWADAAAALQSAKSALIMAERDIEQSQIRAPFDAIVVTRGIEVGAMINHLYPQPPLIKIASASSMAVDGYVNASQLEKIKKGQSAEVKLAGSVVTGKVAQIAMVPAPDREGQYQLRLLVPYKKGLRAGMKAVISVD